jgi:methylenetetrahydrofolate reductase (NADPH)
MSSISASRLLIDEGIEPVMQMVTRDRNRIAIQSDIFGAYALGIKNILCLTGDHQSFGNQPQSANVFDIDSIQLISIVKKMRDEGKILNEIEIQGNPKMFIGAVENPFADPFEYRPIRLAKKIKAGADFIQTQCIYDIKRFTKWMELVRNMGLDEKVFIIAGVTPLKSFEMAKYINDRVSGIKIPDEILERMRKTPKEKQKEEGIKICVETIEQIKNIKGIKGVHIMAIEWESIVGEIVKQAGLYPRPKD